MAFSYGSGAILIRSPSTRGPLLETKGHSELDHPLQNDLYLYQLGSLNGTSLYKRALFLELGKSEWDHPLQYDLFVEVGHSELDHPLQEGLYLWQGGILDGATLCRMTFFVVVGHYECDHDPL